jgi:ribosomal protein RSM22 (predicted rRNA methylase)
MVAATVPDTPAVLLLSHVLTELKPEQTEMLLQLAQRARAVLWVEPGHYEASLTLIAVRERLRASFHLVAPCTQNARCGILHAGNEPHWCHHFAASPPEVFTDPHWGTFAKLAGVDLRSLPLSFLVLDQRPTPPLPSGALRVIGRPRVNKAEALLLGCDAGGVRERRLAQRDLPETFRGLKKGQHYSLAICRQEGERVLEIAPAFLPA